MTLQGRRDGVGERTGELGLGLGVVEDGEVCLEEGVGLADGDGELEPVASGGNSICRDVVGREPFLNQRNGLWGRRNKGFDLNRLFN